MGLGFRGLGCRDEGVKVLGPGFRDEVWELGFRAQGLGFSV